MCVCVSSEWNNRGIDLLLRRKNSQKKSTMKTRSSKRLFTDYKRRKRALKEKQQKPTASKKTRENIYFSTRITRKSKTCFTDLNDDCIEEILRRLPAVELCKFTILNKRLKLIAEEMFKRLYSVKTITFKPTETCATEFGSKITRFTYLTHSILN